jgi:hypothetical protein
MGVPQREALASEGQQAIAAAIANKKGGLRRIKFKASIMNILRLVAVLAIPFSLAFPLGALAQPSSAMTVAQMGTTDPSKVQAAVKTAIQSANLTMKQKMEIKPMVEQYQTQTASADAAQKKTAQEQLLKGIYGVMTPAQQTQFKASMKSSLGGTSPP